MADSEDGADSSRDSTSEAIALLREVLRSDEMTKNAKLLLREVFWTLFLPAALVALVVAGCVSALIVAHAGAVLTSIGTVASAGTGGVAAKSAHKRISRARKKRAKKKAKSLAARSPKPGAAKQVAELPPPRSDQTSIREGQQ